MKYRKRPTVIEAEQWPYGLDKDEAHVKAHDGCALRAVWKNEGIADGYFVTTPSGPVPVKDGYWIAKQVVNGEDDFWPIAPDVFAATYDEASGPDPVEQIKALSAFVRRGPHHDLDQEQLALYDAALAAIGVTVPE